MKKIACWTAAWVVVGTIAAACTVEVVESPNPGGAAGTGGSTGTAGAGTAGAGTSGTAGTSGSAGTSGAGGSSGVDASTDGGGGSPADSSTGGDSNADAAVPMCMSNANDSNCTKCAYNSCRAEACACAAHFACRAAMTDFDRCVSAPNPNVEMCGLTFVVNANTDGGGGPANDLATCMDQNCFSTACQSDGGVRTRN